MTPRRRGMQARDVIRELYEAHRDLFYWTAWLVLRRRDLAEDAVQMAFAKVLANGAMRADGNGKAYLQKAIRTAALDLRRKMARENAYVLEHPPATELGSAQQRQTLDAAQVALEQLDPRTQEIIHLHLHAAMTFREIGELTDTPLQTVAARYRRGLEKIRELIHEPPRTRTTPCRDTSSPA